MSNYAKFDLGTIKTRIKDGTYPSLVGANRAIGKTQGLSPSDRETLKVFAAKHFGVDVSAAKPAKKAGKKAAKKAAAKAPKAAKKVSKKTAKKAGKRAKKTAAKAAAGKATAEPAPAEPTAIVEDAPKVRRGRGKAKAAAGEKVSVPLDVKAFVPSSRKRTPEETSSLIGNVIGSVDQMLRSIENSGELLPKSEAEEAKAAAFKVMSRAMLVLDQEVVSPLLGEKVAAAAPKKASVSSTSSTKPAKVKGNGKPFAASSSPEPTTPVEELELTEEEQAQLALAEELADDNAKAIQANGHLPEPS